MIGFEGMTQHEADVFLMELYAHQTLGELVYSHPWQKDMLVMWDNRSLLHAATDGYDGHARRLHRTTIADTAF
ncbi:MAG: TauD/TfdA family dioxygenase [Pseudomonadota bacterium]